MPTKFFAALLLLAVIATGTPVAAQSGPSSAPLSAEQTQKVAELEAALAADANNPLNRLWQIISRTSLTGMFVDRMLGMVRNYNAQREVNRLNQLKEDRMYGRVKDSQVTPTLDGKKTDTGRVVAPAGDPNKAAPSVAPTSGVKPAGSNTTGGVKGSGGTSAPTTPSKSDSTKEEDNIKTKSGSAVITSFNDGIDGMLSWFGSFFSK